nr:hypothetical protein [Streptomyces graminofaciens]
MSVLDAPAQFRGAHQGGQRRVGGKVGQPELHRFGLVGRPFGQQLPFQQFGTVGGFANLAADRTDPQGNEP